MKSTIKTDLYQLCIVMLICAVIVLSFCFATVREQLRQSRREVRSLRHQLHGANALLERYEPANL